MRVASVVFNYFTNDSRVEKQAISLGLLGFEVTVFALWKNGLPTEQINQNYRICRLPLHLRSYDFKFLGILKFCELILKFAFKIRKFNIVHCHDCTPLISGLLAKMMSFGKLKIIYDAHEYQTEIHNLGSWRKKIFYITEYAAKFFTENLITVSPSIEKEYRKKYRYRKVDIIYNSPKLQKQKILESDILRKLLKIPQNKKIFLFQGSIVPNRGIEEIIEIFTEPCLRDSALVIMGFEGESSESKRLFSRLTEFTSKHKNIHYLPAVGCKDLLKYTASADFGFCLTKDTCLNHRYSLPNKLFEYLSVNTPVLVSALPDMSKVVENHGCGIVAKDHSRQEIQNAIHKIMRLDYQNLCLAAHNLNQEYCWENQEQKLGRIYSEIFVLAK